jgi:FkbM family methyltransferase
VAHGGGGLSVTITNVTTRANYRGLPVPKREIKLLFKNFRKKKKAKQRSTNLQQGFLYPLLLQLQSTNPHSFYFIQIGANDGVSNDPIHDYVAKHKPAGLLIEPLPDVFDRLIANYSYLHPHNLTFKNCAIAKDDGESTIYRIAPAYEPIYRHVYKANANPSAISSFAKSKVVNFIKTRATKTFRVDPSEMLEAIRVPTISITSLAHLTEQSHIHAFFIDAEGMDATIVTDIINCACFDPEIIFFESKNISDDEYSILTNRLAENGYNTCQLGGDACAFKGIRITSRFASIMKNESSSI